MKILSIEIVGFGKWQNKTIDFLEHNQLVYGPNEAGKSTVYQFIQAMLFGFPGKGKKRRNYEPLHGGSYGGYLRLQHPLFGEVQVERFKEVNRGQVKVTMGEQVGGEDLLKKVLHPLTKQLFQSVFTFQQEQLTQLEKLQEDELQTALLALGISGSDQLLQKREDYHKQAQELYKSKGSRPLLNEKLAEYQQLLEKIRGKEQEERQFASVLAQLKDVRDRMAERRLSVRTLKEQLDRVEQQLQNYPLLEEWRQLRQGSRSDVALAPEESQALLELYQEDKFLKQEADRLNRKLQETFAGGEITPDYRFYLQEEETIKRFLDQRYTISKLLSELQWMRESLQQNKQELFILEQKWHWSEDRLPRLFFDDKQLEELRERSVAQRVQRQSEEENLRGVTLDLEIQEKNLEVFESVNQKIFQRSKGSTNSAKSPIIAMLGVSALLAIVGGWLMPAPINWAAWGLGLSCVVAVGWMLLKPKNRVDDQVKQQWQQKLSNLDYLNEQLRQSEARLDRLNEEERKLQEYIQRQTQENNLGEMNRLELWMNHKEELKRYLLLVNTNRELTRQLEEDTKRAGQWLQQTERYVSWLPIVGRDLQERVHIISDFADEMEQQRLLQESQTDVYTKQAIKEIKDKQRRVFEAARPLLYNYQILALEDVPTKLQQYQQSQAADSRIEELQQRIQGMYEENVTLDQLQQHKYQVSGELATADEAIFQLQKDEQRLEFQRRHMVEDGTLDQLYQERSRLRAEIEELAAQWSAYRLAGQLLIDLLTELSEQQLPSLLKKATEYFRVLTDASYTSVQLSDGQLQLKDAAGQIFAVYDLSTGTKDQLVMAVRLAFLSLQGEKASCPVMIDDGWLHYDSQRKKHLANLFKLFGETHQVICFSSDQEMVSYYQEEKQPVVQLEGETR
mgnify:CR=1 FL=1